MSTIQKYVGPDHKISIHQNHNGQWEMALVSSDPEHFFYVSKFQWAVSEDGAPQIAANCSTPRALGDGGRWVDGPSASSSKSESCSLLPP